MAKKKYNWQKIEKQFLSSKFDEVKPFFEDKYKTYNSHIKFKTKNWAENKLQLRQKAFYRAKEDIEKELIEYYKPDIQELWQMHRLLIQLTKWIINDFVKKYNSAENMTIKDLKILREMIKCEKWEPIRVDKSEIWWKVWQAINFIIEKTYDRKDKTNNQTD